MTKVVKFPREIEDALKKPYKLQIVWPNVIGFLVLHCLALYAIYLSIFVAQWPTYLWSYLVAVTSSLGITVGAHRLYTHRCFTANAGLRLFLVTMQTIAGQNCCYVWVRDHRQHHAYSDTPADPHDSNRGFFFSHIGWLMVRKHPAVIAAGKLTDMSDLQADPIVMFQKEHYKKLYFLFAIIIPVAVPYLLWHETFWNAVIISYVGRYVYLLNVTWLVNSAAHIWGSHPYDKTLNPTENRFVAYFTWGEGWHNYHHAFPWDYRASEFGMKWNINASFIKWCANMGWATNLRTASKNMVQRTVNRVGDGSHHLWGDGKKDTVAGVEKEIKNYQMNEEMNCVIKENSFHMNGILRNNEKQICR